MKRINYEFVKVFIESKGCKLISDEYTNTDTKLKIKCKCGETFERRFGDYKNRKIYYCKCCTGKKITYEKVKDFIELKGCKLITIKDDYKNSTEKLNIKCNCGNSYNISYGNFKRFKQYKCAECNEKERVLNMKSKDLGDFNYYNYDQVKDIINKTESKLLSNEYINCFEKLDLICECGKKYNQKFSYIKRKINDGVPILCPKCMRDIANNGFRLDENNINKAIFNIYGYQKYKIVDIEDYRNRRIKTNFIHTECGHIFKSSLLNLLNAERKCPKCEATHTLGILKIKKVLEDMNVPYEFEKTFNDCKYKRLLPFDIYLPNYNCCIEFDGEQHFNPIEYFGGEESLSAIQIRDEIKNNYCIRKNIPLLRIDYKQIDDIPYIVVNFIDKLIPR